MKTRALQPSIMLLCIGLLVVGGTGTALAHGARIDVVLATTVSLEATFDTGEPMAGGHVTVYAPDDPATPWLTGLCDDEGRFNFTPDPDEPGTWDIQVRQAGHGDIVHIAIGTGDAGSSGGGFTAAQIALMSACGVWGLVGTALYFSRRAPAKSQGAQA